MKLWLSVVAAVLIASGCASPSSPVDYQTRMGLEADTTDREKALETATVLEERFNSADLPSAVSMRNRTEEGWNMTLRSSEMNTSHLREYLVKGQFNTSYQFLVKDSRYLNITDEHLLENTGESIRLGSEEYSEGEAFELENTTVRVAETGDISRLDVKLYDGSDLLNVADSRISRGASGYSLTVRLVISQDASERAREISRNYGSEDSRLVMGNGSMLRMKASLAGHETALSVSDVFRERAISQPELRFPFQSKDRARDARKRYVSFLKSGSLPVEVRVQRIES